MVAAAILAAGESRRMGSPKALQLIRGKSFVERLLIATNVPRIGFRCIVLGAGAEEIHGKLNPGGAVIVVNEDWRKGQLSSIHAAIRSLPSGETEGLLLCPVDHPLVSPHLVSQLIEGFDAGGKKIIVPVFHGRRGHPVIFHASLYEELLAASHEAGARQVVHAHPDAIAEVAVEEKGVILNLDDPEALKKVERLKS
ncbi:MAG TPA: nucleotidyltransferase family protein [Candidatus Acidoferrales bacterium]|nr:nucleotidyltransferase family protein [Candidatus Acidoferrales bacterium]